MHVYYDTGVLVPLYVEEVFSDAIANYVEARNAIISLNAFQQLELENALRLKVFRREMDGSRCLVVLDKIKANLADGKLVLRPVDWVLAMDAARRLGARGSAQSGCRTLDLVHVAIAVQWRCDTFVTADDRQLRAARVAGLKIVDVRTLGLRPDDPESGTPSGSAKKPDTK